MKWFFDNVTIIFWYLVGGISLIALLGSVILSPLPATTVAMHTVIAFVSLATIDILKAIKRNEI
jgi:uncharacterized membrane protein